MNRGTIKTAAEGEPAPAKRERKVCNHGHDLTLDGATTVMVSTAGRKTVRCVKCRQVHEKAARIERERKIRCRKGHDLRGPGKTYHDGTCVACRRERNARIARGEVSRTAYARQDQIAQDVRTREMMDLVTMRDRASTWWERKAIDDRFAELQRMNGGGDDA